MLKKHKKFRAFTLIELMIVLSLLTILMAAFAPVFTARQLMTTGGGGVWNFVQNDPNYNAVANNRSFFFIGMAPNSDEVTALTTKGTLNLKISKELRGGTYQNMMQFRYGKNEAGKLIGAFVVYDNNMLLGGPYEYFKSNVNKSVAFGADAMNKISNGNYNVAIGAGSMNQVKERQQVTAIGAYSGWSAKAHDVLIGPQASVRDDDGTNNNVIIGGQYAEKKFMNFYASPNAVGNTIINPSAVIKGSYNGIQNHGNKGLGSYNTSAGYLSLNGEGSNNTAVGYGTLYAQGKDVGNNNTAIGAYAGNTTVNIGNNKTFIGYNAQLPDSLVSDDVERVSIGNVLEVHNMSTKGNSSMSPIPNLGNETVIINGDLIIRGQTYMGIPRIGQATTSGVNATGAVNYVNRPSLAGLKRFAPSSGSNGLIGASDGTRMSIDSVYEGVPYPSGGTCAMRKDFIGREACVCALNGSNSEGTTSYDWFTGLDSTNDNHYSCMLVGHVWPITNAQSYKDLSTNALIKTPDRYFINKGHTTSGETCCPDLRSDIRLKNVEEPFTEGLASIEKIKVKNFTFISDVNKAPHVGVIAQELKKIFPTAVRKAFNGYYEIRWDEIFYSAINAIKELDTKIENLVTRVENNKKRIAQLKRENAELEKQLDKMITEIGQMSK